MVKKVLTIIIHNITQVTYFLIKFLNFITINFRNFSTILYIVKLLSMLFVPNIDKFLTIFLLSPKLPYLSAFLALLPFQSHPSPHLQNLPIYTHFSTKCRTCSKTHKIKPYFPSDHTHSNRSNPKKFLENKGFFLLRSISRSHSTEHHLSNHVLTILFRKLSYNSRLLA